MCCLFVDGEKTSHRPRPNNPDDDIQTDGGNPSEIPSGDVINVIQNLSPGSGFYGNNVTLRQQYLPAGARKSFIDENTMLAPGVLKEILFYTHTFTNPALSGPVHLRLQVWKPVSALNARNNYMYELIWEHRVGNIVEPNARGKLWRVRIEYVLIDENIKINWEKIY